MRKLRDVLFVVAALVVGFAAVASAAGAQWMTNFPMRMGAAGVMGMWMPVPGAAEYKVMRQVAGGPWEQIYKGPMNNFTDPAAPADKDVGYKVIAVVGGKDGDDSVVAVLKGEKAIESPENLSGRLDPATKSFPMRWNNASGASFYNVYRADAEGDTGTLLGSITDLRYSDTTIQEGKTYWYYVTAVSATSQESKRAAPLKVDVKYPKEVKVKRFDLKQRELELVGYSYGEDFDTYKNPSDILFLNGFLYVACEDGVQVVDQEGKFVRRLPIFQEKISAKVWTRPSFMAVSPAGNIYFSFVNQNRICEITPDGVTLVREIVLPDMPTYPGKAAPISIATDPEGNLWITDSAYGNIAILAPGVGDAPAHDKIVRLGWAKGKTMYDEAKDGMAFVGPTRILYLPGIDRMAILEATAARASIFDWKERKRLYTFGGMGGGLQQFSLLGGFTPYDNESVLALDALQNHLKRLKVTKDASDTAADYLDSWVDETTDPQNFALRSPSGGVNMVQYAPSIGRIYVLAGLMNEVVVYQIKK